MNEKAHELKQQGKSIRDIATELQVSKSTVHRWLQEPINKSWLNPTWVNVSGGDPAPVDAYGAIAAPSPDKLIAMNEDTVFFCTDWIAKNVGKNPLKLFVKTYKGQNKARCLTAPAVLKSAHLQHIAKAADVQEVIEHPLMDLLSHPNPDMSRYDFMYYLDAQLSLVGQAFIHIVRDEDGLPCYLYPLLTARVRMIADKGQVIGYSYDLTSPPQFYKKEDVIHLKLCNAANPYAEGYSPVRACYERILLGKNELAYLNSLFRNQARPDVLIKVSGGIATGDVEALQKQLSQRFRQGGQGGPWVIDAEDMEVQNLSWSPKDVLGTELYKWTKLQIINAFSLNPAVFDSESSNRAVAATARRQSQSEAIEPRLRLVENKLNHQLVPEFDSRLLLEFDSPVEEDEDFDLEQNTMYLDRGVYTINEVRQRLGLLPVSWGDTPCQNGTRDSASAMNSSGVSAHSE